MISARFLEVDEVQVIVAKAHKFPGLNRTVCLFVIVLWREPLNNYLVRRRRRPLLCITFVLLSFYLTFSRATRSKPVADEEAYRTLHRGFSNQVCQVKDLEKLREITWEQVRHRQPRGIAGSENAQPSSNISFWISRTNGHQAAGRSHSIFNAQMHLEIKTLILFFSINFFSFFKQTSSFLFRFLFI